MKWLLVYSYKMMDQGRALKAKEFIDTALEKYSRAKDIAGMAETYHAYGNYYKVTMYAPFRATMYPHPGKEDIAQGYAEFTAHQDYRKSEESFRKAIELYESIDGYEGLTKSYFGLGNALSLQGRDDEAMKAYDTSLIYYQNMKSENPSAELNILADYKDGLEMINAFREELKRKHDE